MGELAARAEVYKLANELGTDPDRLDFLKSGNEAALTELRQTITSALFALHEPRLRRIAGFAKLLPPGMSAKIAQGTLPPMLCGRIAGVLDTGIAVKLASHVKPTFLAEMSSWVDPGRTADIVRNLPDDLVLNVARILLDEGAYIVLGRFVAVVDDALAAQVMDMANGAQLLEASFYAEDRSRIDPLLAHVPDERLVDVIRAAADADQFDEAVSLLVFIGPDGQERLIQTLLRMNEPAAADGVVRAIVNLDAWPELLPVVSRLSAEAITLLVNVPTTRDPKVISALVDQVLGQRDVIERARELGLFPMLVTLLDALDDEHRAVLRDVAELDDPELRALAAELVAVPIATIDEAIEAFRTGAELPAELVRAL